MTLDEIRACLAAGVDHYGDPAGEILVQHGYTHGPGLLGGTYAPTLTPGLDAWLVEQACEARASAARCYVTTLETLRRRLCEEIDGDSPGWDNALTRAIEIVDDAIVEARKAPCPPPPAERVEQIRELLAVDVASWECVRRGAEDYLVLSHGNAQDMLGEKIEAACLILARQLASVLHAEETERADAVHKAVAEARALLPSLKAIGALADNWTDSGESELADCLYGISCHLDEIRALFPEGK